MLYHLYDWHKSLLSPVRVTAETLQHIYSHPYVPFAYTQMGRAVAAGAELVERATRRYRKPDFGLDAISIDGREVAVDAEVVDRRTFCDLVHFRRDTPREDPRVLIVAPLSGHFASLLRDTVAAMLPDHDVYITDWIDAASVPLSRGHFDLDDYVDYLVEFIRRLGPELHVIAVCQPSVPVVAAVSLMAACRDPATPRSMTLMGGPIDTRVNPTKVNLLARHRSLRWFERAVITTVPPTYPAFLRRVYPGFIQLTGFMTMNLDRHVGSHMDQFRHLVRGDGESAGAHRRFYDEYLSVMDLPAEFFLQTVKIAFQDHALPLGTWISRDRPVEPRAIDATALMTVEGEFDDISAPGQTRAAHYICTNVPPQRRRHLLQPHVGHFGIFSGRRWRTEILPQLRSFIRDRS